MICKIKNNQTGEVRDIGLPKGRKEINAFLMDFGITEDNGYAHEIVGVGTKSKAVSDEIVSRKLTIDELNAFSYIYTDTRNHWDTDFILALEVEKPETVMEFLNVAAEVPVYHFFKVSSLEELGKFFISEYPEEGKGLSARAVGELIHNRDNGRFVKDNLYCVKKNEYEDYVPDYYNGYELDCKIDEEESDGVLVLTIAEKEAYVKHVDDETVCVPSVEIILPTTEYEIKRALHRFEGKEICLHYHSIHNFDVPFSFCSKEEVFKLNKCTELWAGIQYDEYLQDKVTAIRNSTNEEETMDTVISIFDVLNSYTLYPNIYGVEDLEEYKIRYGVDLPEGKTKEEFAEEILSKYEHYYEDEGLLVKTDGEDVLEKYFVVDWV